MARRSDHSREEIQKMAIKAAIAILSREGVQGLSTRKVAGAIGYTVGTLYLVFKNLDELILYVNAAALNELHEIMAVELAEYQDPQSQLLAMAQAYLGFARENFARWSLLFSHRLPEDVALPNWFRDKVNVLFRMAAIPLQQIRPQLSETQYQQATHVLWSSVHGVCELGLNDKLAISGEIYADELMDALVKNFLRGFRQDWD
jgi:AcrR family transcriptional regulator